MSIKRTRAGTLPGIPYLQRRKACKHRLNIPFEPHKIKKNQVKGTLIQPSSSPEATADSVRLIKLLMAFLHNPNKIIFQ